VCAGFGCGDSDDDPAGNAGAGGSGGGAQCQAPDTYRPGITKTGENGVSVAIVDASPAMPGLLVDNEWTIEVKGPDGAALDGATIDIDRTMPAHDGHSNARTPLVAPQGSGRYELAPMYFNMEGVWRIAVDVTKDALRDTITFELCIVGS
jgi:hypothetical protein